MKMLSLMDQMDRELAGTEVGKSFEKESSASDRTKVCKLSKLYYVKVGKVTV